MIRILLLCLGLLWGGVVGSALAWAQAISHSEVEGLLDLRLRAILEGAGTGVFVTTISCPADLKLPDGAISWELGPGVEGWEPGLHTLPVTAFVEGATAARVQVLVTLKQRVQVPVLRRDFKRGEVVGQEDVQLLEVELAAVLPGRLREASGAVGKAVTRDVRANQPLLEKWLEGPVVVERGDRVRVTLLRGGLRIETSGVAVQRGRVGEFISVRNPESKSVYDAQITGPGEAQVKAW
ncbi:MAG: flagellar basal body P-ring formation protein FlgA [Magnetococcales bacterium]|nr:flagellar basal body P-ring formation protein FlgA [Magnetococcales bacterium]